MRKLIIVLILALNACSVIDDSSLYSFLFSKTQSDISKSEHYQSCLLFAELSISDKQLENMLFVLKAKNKQNLCDSYILASQTQDPIYINEFIKHIPTGIDLSNIWSIHTKLDYPVSFIPPYISMTRNLASQNDMALDKLISALPSVDGSHSESLAEMIADLYNKNPSRVINSIKRNKISNGTASEIKQLAEYLKRN